MQALQQMGADGWLGIGWPKEYGGQGRSPIEQFIFFDEVQRAGFPLPFLTLNTVGPTIMQFGTEEQKRVLPAAHPARRAALRDRLHRAGRRHRPRVATHRAPCATATTGSSTAARSSPAWPSTPTTSGSRRAPIPTRQEAQRHLDLHGPDAVARLQADADLRTMGDVRTNATYYEDVRVPAIDAGRAARTAAGG